MIRKAQYTDISMIELLLDWGSSRGSVLKRSRKEIKENIHFFYVFEQNQQIIACCSLERYQSRLAEIRSLVVLPQYQGRGIAQQLLDTCLSEAKILGIEQIIVITDKGYVFKKHGFSSQVRSKQILVHSM